MALNLSGSLNLEGQIVLSGSLSTTQIQYITSSNSLTSSHLVGSVSNAISSSYSQTSSYLTVANYNVTSSWSNNTISSSYSLSASYFGSGSNNYFPIWSSNKLSYNSLISQSNNQISILSDTASFLGNTLIVNKSDPFYLNNNPTIDTSNSTNQTLMLTPNVMLGGNGNGENWNRFNSNGTVDFLGSKIKFLGGGSAAFNSSVTIGSLTLVGENTLDVIGNIKASVITASRLVGTADTASYFSGSISNAISSSYAATSSYMMGSISNAVSSSYALTSSYSLSSSFAPTNTNITASWSNNSISSSYSLSSSYSVTSSFALNAGTLLVTGSVYSITSSWSNNAVSSSFNPNAFIQNGNSFGVLATLGTNDSQSLAFETNNNEWVRIDTTGNVGIGTTIPRGKLHVVGNITASSVTASLLGTSSWSNNSISSSQAATASFAPTNISYITSTVRIVIGASRSNANAFYFNAFTRTSDASAAVGADSAFLIPASGLSTVNVYLRQSGVSPSNTTDIGVYRSADGSDFNTATLLNTSSSKAVTQHTVQTYTFSGLTLNANDCIYIYCKPTTGGSNYSGIVVVS